MFTPEQLAAMEQEMAEEHRKDIEALQRLKRFAHPSAKATRPAIPIAEAPTLFTPPKPPSEPGPAEEPAEEIAEVEDGGNEGDINQPTIMSKIVEVLGSEPNRQFTVWEFIKTAERQGYKFAAKKPESSVSLAFAKLLRREKIRRIHKGSGRSPHIYKALKTEGVATVAR